MPQVAVPVTPPRRHYEDRRKPDAVLGLEGGPSRRGSTYWTRVMLCPWEHLLANVLGWRSLAPHDPLDQGIIWHWCLEKYYEVKGQAQRAHPAWVPFSPGMARIPYAEFFRAGEDAAQKRAFAELQRFAAEPGYEKIYSQCEAMLEGYFDTFRTDRWQVVAVEPTIQLEHPLEYSARLDLVIVDHRGKPVTRNVEHKSSWRLDSSVLEGYTQDLQVRGQAFLCLRALDFTVYPTYTGPLVNIATKHSKRPRFERVPVQATEAQLEAWARSVAAASVERDGFEAAGYPQRPANCTRKFGKCEFFDLCRTRPELTPQDMIQITKKGELPKPYVTWDVMK